MQCNICEGEIKGSCQAGAHIGCYARENPPKAAKTVRELVVFAADPVIARNVIMDLIEQLPSDVVNSALNDYNKRLYKMWQGRCDVYKAGE